MTSLSTRSLELSIGNRTLCTELNLKLEPGQCWAILGSNGSGKTTLLHTLAGLRPPERGEISLNDTPLPQLSRQHIAQQLGLLLQESHDPFPTTAMETALSGRHPHLGRWQQESTEDRQIATEALDLMDLEGMAERMVQTLSGGERRRLALATLFTQQPELMLLDEPLNHLDLRHQQLLLKQLRQFAQQHRTIAMVLHDPNQAWRFCNQTLLLYGDGEWEAGETRIMLSSERLERLYGYPMKTVGQGEEQLFIPA